VSAPAPPAGPSLTAHSPRDGRGLTFTQLVHALTTVYNNSTPLAWVLALSALVVCGTGPPWRRRLDLAQLARHDRLEHDASLVHADAAPGARYAPTTTDPALLAAFLAAAPRAGMDERTLVRYRAERELALGNPLRGVRAGLQLVAAAEALAGLNALQDPHTGAIARARIVVSGQWRCGAVWSADGDSRGMGRTGSRTTGSGPSARPRSSACCGKSSSSAGP
jgi:hypothetical protein